MDDAIIDYFRFEDKDQNKAEICYLSDILKLQGIAFENKVINSFKKNIVNDYNSFITIAKSQKDIVNNNKYIETLNAMKLGIPFIYQGVLHDPEYKIYGSPDLLVRNDCINILCDDIQEPIPILSKYSCFGNYYYIVIDIKSSILRLRANGNNILNYGRMVGYKGQLYVYYKILSQIQKYDSNIAFILGKKYVYIKNNEIYSGLGWFDKLGCINYNTIDSHIKNKVYSAIEWRRNIQLNYNKMILYPVPSNDNLYPNMCNRYDDKYRKRKRKLAECISEHTLVSWVSVKHRKLAHANRIYGFMDKRCNIDTLGMTGNITRKIVNTILKINQSTSRNFTPNKIRTNMYNWRNTTTKEAFVDFETVPLSILEKYDDRYPKSISDSGQIIYLIGIWYFNSSKKNWEYKAYISEKINIICEHKILQEFTNFINDLKIIKLYHWGKSAEPVMYNRSSLRMDQIKNAVKYNTWCDLCTLFKNENIGIKGATTYGLKDVAQAMKSHNMINTYWKPGIFNGVETIAMAWNINNEMESKNYNKLLDDPRMNNIIEYNKTDCVILHEILTYLKRNH